MCRFLVKYVIHFGVILLQCEIEEVELVVVWELMGEVYRVPDFVQISFERYEGFEGASPQ